MAGKINMRLDKNEMPSQDPQVRNKNFLEVALGYTEEQALDEAARCLNCKNHPCVDGCPVNVRIPEFIQKIVEKDYEGAYQVIHQTSSLPAVCGRVCPQESQCEQKCVRGIKGEPVGIGRLERFVADWWMEHGTQQVQRPAPTATGWRWWAPGTLPATALPWPCARGVPALPSSSASPPAGMERGPSPATPKGRRQPDSKGPSSVFPPRSKPSSGGRREA